MKELFEDYLPVWIVVLVALAIFVITISYKFVDDYQTRIMADKGFCYEHVDVTNGPGNNWTWLRCK